MIKFSSVNNCTTIFEKSESLLQVYNLYNGSASFFSSCVINIGAYFEINSFFRINDNITYDKSLLVVITYNVNTSIQT